MAALPENAPGSKTGPIVGAKASWTQDMEQTLIQIMLAKKVEYNMKTDKFKKVRWMEIEKEFNLVYGTHYSHKQMKGKAQILKREWGVWKKIKAHTGVRWDNDRHMFTYGDWDALDKVCTAFNILLGEPA